MNIEDDPDQQTTLSSHVPPLPTLEIMMPPRSIMFPAASVPTILDVLDRQPMPPSINPFYSPVASSSVLEDHFDRKPSSSPPPVGIMEKPSRSRRPKILQLKTFHTVGQLWICVCILDYFLILDLN